MKCCIRTYSPEIELSDQIFLLSFENLCTSLSIFQILLFCYATEQHNKSCVARLCIFNCPSLLLINFWGEFSPELRESSVNTSGQPPSLIDTAGCRPRNYSEVTQKCRFYLSVARHHSARCGDSGIRNASDARHRCLLGARETAGIAFALWYECRWSVSFSFKEVVSVGGSLASNILRIGEFR